MKIAITRYFKNAEGDVTEVTQSGMVDEVDAKRALFALIECAHKAYPWVEMTDQEVLSLTPTPVEQVTDGPEQTHEEKWLGGVDGSSASNNAMEFAGRPIVIDEDAHGHEVAVNSGCAFDGGGE